MILTVVGRLGIMKDVLPIGDEGKGVHFPGSTHLRKLQYFKQIGRGFFGKSKLVG